MRDNALLLQLKRKARVRTRGLEFLEREHTRLEKTRERLLMERYARWRAQPIRPRTVMYESFSGSGALCNPEAIFRYLLAAPDMADLQHIWALDDLERHESLSAEFADTSNVSFVEIGSAGYLKALATSAYLFNNATFPPEFAKRSGQVYVNTWHGVPLKHMGYDLEGGGPASRNVLRNLVAADYLVSSNQFMTDTIYRHAYRLQGVYRGKIIEEGQPRTDRQFAAHAEPGPVLKALRRGGVDPAGRKVILFAPTWKGGSLDKPLVNAQQLVSVVQELQGMVDSERYVVLLKVHQIIYDAMLSSGKGRGVLVPNDIPTNSIVGVSDVLVTDYSSILYDFMASRLPILHYIPDLDEYESGRGLYVGESELFGPRSQTVPQLAEQIAGLDDNPPQQSTLYKKAVDAYVPYEDGRVSERVVNLVFRQADPAEYNLHSDFSNDKQSILIYLGSLVSMGITTSALNLLKNLDYDRFDVSVLYHFSRGRDRVKNEALIDPRARLFLRMEPYVGSPHRLAQEKTLMSKGLPARPPVRHQRFWEEEWGRLFGMCEFNYAVDFSGYGTFCPFLFTAAKNSTKSLWLHSDLMSESQRETVGDKHLKGRLNAVFSTFRYFDHLVSVSAELNRVNSGKLSAFAPPEKFTFASNTIDEQRVLTMAGLNHAGERVSGDEATYDSTNIAAAMSSLLKHFDVREILREARTRARMSYVPVRGEPTVTFVTTGRMSPEKNYGRLVRAFSRVHERHPHTRLVIIGDGRLMDQVTELVESLGLEDYVSLAGQVDNPYSIMADSDCFVMSSDYEGQPMVILEARTLDLPIVTTRFASVGGSVPEGAGLIVEQTDEALAAGMEQFLAGKAPSKRLDWDSYNDNSMRQFYKAIGADPVD